MEYKLKSNQFPPKTLKQIKKERKQMIEEYLDGNFGRFLRRNNEKYKYQLVYSKDLKNWRKDKRVNIVNYLTENYTWPSHICLVVNTMKTLVKYYDRSMGLGTMHLAIAIIDLFEEDMYDYSFRKQSKLFGLDIPYKQLCSSEQALKEQKARGFIHINKFDDYDSGFSHVYSNVDKDYVYPLNLPHVYSQYNSKIPSDYVALPLIGVSGYTIIVTPKL